MHDIRRACAVFLATLAVGLTASAAEVETFEATVRGLGTVEFRLADGGTLRTSIFFPDRGPYRCGIQNDEHEYISYAERMGRMRAHQPLPPYTPISNCVVQLSAPWLMKRDVELLLLPYFHSSYGLYSHADIVKNLPFWKSVYPLAPERAYEFAFVPDAVKGRTLVYLDGSVLAATNAVLDVVSATVRGKLELVKSGKVARREVAGMHFLPQLAAPSRASDLLKEGATLSLKPGWQTVGGVPMDVWAVADSIDRQIAALREQLPLISDRAEREHPASVYHDIIKGTWTRIRQLEKEAS